MDNLFDIKRKMDSGNNVLVAVVNVSIILFDLFNLPNCYKFRLFVGSG